MDYQQFTAKTKEEAITAACLSFGVTSDQLDYTVEEEGSSGFLGLGHKDAVIKARVLESGEVKAVETKEEKPKIKTLDEIEAKAQAAAANKSESDYEKKSDDKKRAPRKRGGRRTEEEIPDYTPSVPKPEREVVKRTDEEIEVIKTDAEKFLTEVFSAMNVDVNKNIAYDNEAGCLECEFSGEEMGILIGKRGQTLDALQYLTSLVVNKNQKDYVRVKLDTEEYRRRRKDTLESLAKNIAKKVERTHRAVVLEPMNPYERRIIHSALQTKEGIETYSEGDEPFRRVVVTPKKRRG